MNKKILVSTLLGFVLTSIAFTNKVHAAGLVDVKIGNQGDLTSSVQIFIMVAILTIAPSIFIMVTCFTQVVIILGLTRQGLGTNTLPPNQVMMGLALCITLYIMSPVITTINKDAYAPYEHKKISFQTAVNRAEVPLKKFMVANTDTKDLTTMLKLRKDPQPKKPEDVNILAAIPAFTLSQISEGLFKGLMIYGGFVAIDMLVGSILMFMSMMMIPPQMLSLPLKLLIFVYIGGFGKVVELIFSSVKV